MTGVLVRMELLCILTVMVDMGSYMCDEIVQNIIHTSTSKKWGKSE